MQKRDLLEQALREHGVHEPSQIESHILACDLSFPVLKQVLPQDTEFDVWVRIGGNPGRYAAPAGEYPGRLGIMVEGRYLQRYKVRTPLRVVRCTAASFPGGLVERVGGQGGGTQFILSPGWLNAVERIL